MCESEEKKMNIFHSLRNSSSSQSSKSRHKPVVSKKGSGECDQEHCSLRSSPAFSRRCGNLSSLPEKPSALVPASSYADEESKSASTDFLKTEIKVPEVFPRRHMAVNLCPPCPGFAPHLSPGTLRRLEHKHQVAKLRQEQQQTGFSLLGGVSPGPSPPASPQTMKRIIVRHGGESTRRFTVARTRLVVLYVSRALSFSGLLALVRSCAFFFYLEYPGVET